MAGDDLLRQLNEIQKEIARDISAALGRRKMSEVIIASTYAASFGEVVRIAPPSGGTRLVLPAPNLGALDSRITAVVEAASGALSVEVVDGLINGSTTLTYLAGIGTVEFALTPTGWYGWSVSLVNDLPLTALADQIAESFLGNFTAGAAPPTARAGSSVAGAGLTYSAGGTLAVGAGTGITVAADAVGLTDMAAATIKGRALGAGTGAATDLTAGQVADIIEGEAFTWTGAWNCNNRVRWSNIFTQTLTGNTDDLAIGAVNVVRLVGNTFNLTGMVPNADDQLVWLQNADAADTLVLAHDATSTAANRFYLPNNANYTMQPRSAVWARYDAASTRWYIGVGA